MTQIFVWLAIALLIYFIFKIGSFIWRLIGFLAIVFLLWIFREDIFSQVNQWVSNFDSDDLGSFLKQAADFIVEKFNQVVAWFQQLLA
ncbi:MULTISPECIES: hypothetical protein [Enterococcus]|uniref:hypothetical protein n=1 Tax=Enterococcus TaxID=1350 RepID=UPI00065E41A3|nr:MULTISPECIES: hypothetical protein [Enterococcus]KAF1301284.1 hypothetical protein BAU16_09810 [Enterococcus sp. JM9B]